MAFAAAGLSYLHAAAAASKAYVIAEITVTDADAYKRYAVLVPPIAAKFGGKFPRILTPTIPLAILKRFHECAHSS